MKIIHDYRNRDGSPVILREGFLYSLDFPIKDENNNLLFVIRFDEDILRFHVSREEKEKISKLLDLELENQQLLRGKVYEPRIFRQKSLILYPTVLKFFQDPCYLFVFDLYEVGPVGIWLLFAYALLKEEPEESEYYLRKAEEEWAEYERRRQEEAKMNEEKRMFEREYERRHKRHWWEFWKLL